MSPVAVMPRWRGMVGDEIVRAGIVMWVVLDRRVVVVRIGRGHVDAHLLTATLGGGRAGRCRESQKKASDQERKSHHVSS